VSAAAPAYRTGPILAVLLLAGASFALSQTMVLPALPVLSEELDADPAATSWLLTAYLLTASVATPIIGKLGDLHGKGRVMFYVLLTFSAGSVLCALADTIGLVIAGRAIQGVAGGVFPLSFGIIRDTFPRERVAGAIGMQSAIFGIGGGIGLPLSGIIVDHGDVSLLFWLGLVALPAAVLALRVIPPSATIPHARVDWPGALLLSAALVSLLLGVTEAEDWGWTSAPTVILVAGGAALLLLWVRFEMGRPEPLVDIALLRRRAVAATNLCGFLVGFAMFSSFLLIPQFVQAPEGTGYGFDLTVTQAGLVLVPSALVQLAAGPVAGMLGTRLGFRITLAIGAGLAAISFTLLAFVHSSPVDFLVAGAFLGAGISFAFASMANLIVAAVPPTVVGVATGINTITRTVGGAFGSAAAVAILSSATIAGSPLPTEGAYTAAFVMSACGSLLALAAALLTPPRTASGPGAAVAAAPAGAR